MTPRAKHLEEIRYALAHNLPLAEARVRLAREKRRASEQAIENLRNATVSTRRDPRDRARQIHERNPILDGPAPWMMRD